MPTTKVELAREFAVLKHGDQLYGTLPYVVHLEAVAKVLERFGVDDESMLAAAYLHDVMEDCGVSEKEVADRFGDRVADLVWAVTNQPGKNRKDRIDYGRIRCVDHATQLKLADRIANVEQCLKDEVKGGKSKLGMYQKEFVDFVIGLYRPNGQYARMWKHLANLMDVGDLLEGPMFETIKDE